MSSRIKDVLPGLKRSLLTGVLMLLAAGAQASELNVCAGKNEMPFSNQDEQGFENEIAKVVAAGLNRKVNFVWWSDARYIVRDYLDKQKCDVIMGVDASDPRVDKTAPYYKSGYVFISRADRNIDITSWEDPILKERNFRIGVLPDSPGKNLLLQIGRYDDMFDYFAELTNYESTRNKYIRIDPKKLVDDVESKHLHMAMLWGPEAGRYVKAAKVPLRMQVIDDTVTGAKGQKVPMHYEVQMGVRKGDDALRKELDKVLKAKHAEIEAILKKESIPLITSNQ